jgi:hypothetical protein
MTQNPLRLVVDHGDDTAPDAIDLRPGAGAALHIHLHMASQDAQLLSTTAVLTPETRERGRSGRGVTRPLLLGVAGVLVAVVAFDLGAHSGAGHAAALAAARTRAAPGELPASVQQQLARRPTVTPPPGAATSAESADPFGLQH